MESRCAGCGAKIQTTDSNKKGYLNEQIYLSSISKVYCERCFNLRHYNKNTEITISEEEFIENSKKIAKDGGLVVNIVDAFDLEGTFIYNINSLFPTNDIILVLNKSDLFMKSVNLMKIKSYVYNFLKENNVKVKDLVIMSSIKESDIKMLMNKISIYNKGKNIFFFGTTNVGKSTLINNIIKYYYPDSLENITVSNMISTTLDFIKIALDKKTFLVDSPGIVNNKQITYYLTKKSLNYVIPKKFVKPLVFQLQNNQTIFINGFCYIDFLCEEKVSIVVNCSNNLLIHRTKMENAFEFYQKHYEDILLIPIEEERNKLGELVTDTFDIDKEKMDIYISGIGFVTVVGKVKAIVHHFENNLVGIRKAIV